MRKLPEAIQQATQVALSYLTVVEDDAQWHLREDDWTSYIGT